MIKQLSSFDIHFLAQELNSLVGSRVDKIYNSGKEELYFQLYKANEGKKLLRVIVGKALFLSSKKQVESIPSEFCMFLRKHLDGKKLSSVEQIKPERIVKLTFQSKDSELFLYVEQFAKGNVILCDGNIALDSVFRQKFKDRSILPKKPYSYPSMNYNVFEIDDKIFSEFVKKTKKEKIITALATELGLGGVYSEEACIISGVDKNKKPRDLSESEKKLIVEAIAKISKKKIKAHIVYENKKAIDITPFSFEHYKERTTKEFESFNQALEHYFTKDVSLSVEIKSPYEKQINQLQRIISEQEETITNLEKKEVELKQKGDLIYEKYILVKEILDEINKATANHSWKEIKEKLKDHKIVKEVDVKEKKVVVDL